MHTTDQLALPPARSTVQSGGDLLLICLIFGCQNDRYLNNTIVKEVSQEASAQDTDVITLTCDGPMINASPNTLEFLSILTPFPEDIALRTDTQGATIKNNCDGPLDIYMWATQGDVGTFTITPKDGDRDGAGSGEIVFTIPEHESHLRDISYTANSDAALADYDDGRLELHVIENDELGFPDEISLEATIINVFTAN